MTKEIKQYFLEQYEKANFKVVTEHWPDFKSKQEIDKWIKIREELFNEDFNGVNE